MEWISVDDRLPILKGKESYASEEFLIVIPQGDKFKTVSADWCRTTIRGKIVERWEWKGKICPWKPTHWQPLPSPPESRENDV